MPIDPHSYLPCAFRSREFPPICARAAPNALGRPACTLMKSFRLDDTNEGPLHRIRSRGDTDLGHAFRGFSEHRARGQRLCLRRLAGAAVAALGLLVVPATLAPSEVIGDAFAGFRRSLERREYHASPNRSGLQAPNRSQDLRTYFEATGIRVHDRSTPGASELLSLSFSGVGRGNALAAIGPGDVTSDGPRVEIRRAGLLEWYENSPAGLEQGFTLAEPPAGEGPLVVELALHGATASLRGDAVIFAARNGRRIRYDGLVAVDSSGRTHSARLSAPTPDRVRIEVEDAGARYPLVIDPLISDESDSILVAVVPGDFGCSVAGAGDVNGDGFDDVIVGAPNYDWGAAFVKLGEADADADGAPDSTDNCLSQRNPSQLDSDGDGFGNYCDADFDQNGAAGGADFATFRRCWAQALPASAGPLADPTCEESDMDGDSFVSFQDFALFRTEFGTPAGP